MPAAAGPSGVESHWRVCTLPRRGAHTVLHALLHLQAGALRRAHTSLAIARHAAGAGRAAAQGTYRWLCPEEGQQCMRNHIQTVHLLCDGRLVADSDADSVTVTNTI